MRKIAAVLLCLLPLTAAAGKELKLDLKYTGAIHSAHARAEDRVDTRRDLGHALAKGHAKASNGRHGFGRLWAHYVRSTHGSRPGRCKP